MPFIPHTANEVKEMLTTIGVNKIEELFSEIPDNLKNKELKNISEGLTEMEMARVMQQRAAQNQNGLCFLGAGAYEHHMND